MAKPKKRAKAQPPSTKIVILQRGWVFVGLYSTDGEKGQLVSAKCIRRWGTTRGLGELVNGPLEETTLDPAGIVTFHELTVVGMLDASGAGWHQALFSDR